MLGGVLMKIIRKQSEKYGLQKIGKNCHRIIKILVEYEKEQEAINDLTRLVTGEITEQDLVEKRKIAETFKKD